MDFRQREKDRVDDVRTIFEVREDEHVDVIRGLTGGCKFNPRDVRYMLSVSLERDGILLND